MGAPVSAHSFHEVQLEHARWQASWLMADSDATPPSHPLAAGSGLLVTQVTRVEGVSPITVAGPHRIHTGFPFQPVVRWWLGALLTGHRQAFWFSC